MKQLKFYKYATYFLLVINMIILFFFFLGRPKHGNPNKGVFVSEAARMMNLSEEQIEKFKDSTVKHHQGISRVKREQNKILKPYFDSIYKKSDSVNTDSLFSMIKKLEGEKIKITEVHFKEVESMLEEKQKPEFKHFMDKAVRIILNDGKQAPPRKMNKE